MKEQEEKIVVRIEMTPDEYMRRQLVAASHNQTLKEFLAAAAYWHEHIVKQFDKGFVPVFRNAEGEDFSLIELIKQEELEINDPKIVDINDYRTS